MSVREKHDGAAPDAGHADGRATVRLWLRLLSCAMIVEKRLQRRFAARFATTLPRFDVLAALDRHPGGMTMGALSRSLLVSNGNVTALVQTLARDGWVSLTPSPDDRRASIVAPTTTGAARFAAMAEAHGGWIDDWLGGLAADERATLYALLGRLKDSLPEERP